MKKLWLFALCLTACVGASPGAEEPVDVDLEGDENVGEAPQGLPTSFCILHQHSGYGGASLTVPYGWDFNDLHSKGMGDEISSLSCTSNTIIYVCEHKHWLGYCRSFSGSVSNLGSYDLNDKLSSVSWQSPPLPQ